MAFLTASLAALALAQAPPPTLESTLPCFSPETGAQLTGTGWTANEQVRLVGRYVPGGEAALDHTVTADVNGQLQFSSGLPDGAAVRSKVEVTATEVSHPERVATVGFTLSWFGPFFEPWNTNGAARGRPGKVSTIEASGYVNETGASLYAHYVLRGEAVKTVRVGRLTGPCGALKKRFRQFAFKPVPKGTYTVYFDVHRVFGALSEDSPRYSRVVVR